MWYYLIINIFFDSFISKLLLCFSADFPNEAYNIETIQNGTSSRIYDGTKANGYLPYQVFLVMKLRIFLGIYSYITCGGTVISPNHILTARHCVVDDRNYFKFSSDDVLVRVGSNTVSRNDILTKNGVSVWGYFIMSILNKSNSSFTVSKGN